MQEASDALSKLQTVTLLAVAGLSAPAATATQLRVIRLRRVLSDLPPK